MPNKYFIARMHGIYTEIIIVWLMMVGHIKCAPLLVYHASLSHGVRCVACVCVCLFLFFGVSVLCYICCCTIITTATAITATIQRERGKDTMIQVIKDFLLLLEGHKHRPKWWCYCIYIIIAIRNAMMIRFKQCLKYKPIYYSIYRYRCIHHCESVAPRKREGERFVCFIIIHPFSNTNTHVQCEWKTEYFWFGFFSLLFYFFYYLYTIINTCSLCIQCT